MDGTIWFPRDHRLNRSASKPFRVKTTLIIVGSLAVIGLALAGVVRHDEHLANLLAQWVVAIDQTEM